MGARIPLGPFTTAVSRAVTVVRGIPMYAAQKEYRRHFESDYNLKENELYTKVVKVMISTYGTLDMFSWVTGGEAISLKLPLWVPEFGEPGIEIKKVCLLL